VSQYYTWEEIIPVEETYAAARFMVATWYLIGKLNPEYIKYEKPEPKLTEMLCHYLKRRHAESGVTGFWVNEDQEPLFEGDSMQRIKKDITYYSNASRFRLELIFEFKKLSQSSISTYRGKDGMRRFVDGNYAPQKPLAIMVGITLKGSFDDVIKALYKSLSRVDVQSELKMVRDSKGRYIRMPSEAVRSIAEFDTEHNRPADKTPPKGTTTIAHIFLICDQ
jgi:hypothetical protein